jgi:pimeloyl-ACP methyl ester carboxylesterase
MEHNPLLRRLRFLPWAVVLVFAAAAAVSQTAPTHDGIVTSRAPVPAPDCQARVGYDRDAVLPGYLLPTSAGAWTCIPFTTARFKPPAGYKGDFYVDEFTDAKLRAQWEECKKDKSCYDRVYAQVMARHPPNRERSIKDPHKRFLLGKIEEKGDATDLASIRRPAYFAREPYREPIAADDAQTYIVEFTAPAEAYERLHLHNSTDVKLRGWYIQGAGVDDGKGHKVRSLITVSGGGGDRVTAIDDPRDAIYRQDPVTGATVLNDYPNATTGAKGMAVWRGVVHGLHQAGFDVLEFDRRGVGISSGTGETNTLQQGHDLLEIVASLRSGNGMRALTPSGALLRGHEAAAAVHGSAPDAGMPVFLLGSSRGTMASSWAMTINFDKDCSYDLPEIQCSPARHDPHIKGAILIAEFSSGVGYLPAETSPNDDSRGPGRDRGLFIGGIEVEHNIVFFPSSATLAGIHTWPSLFLARGLWCYADGLEGSMDSYGRVNGPKDLVVVRGPHAFETWPETERQRTLERMIVYARTVLAGGKTVPGRRTWSNMKELVATSSDVWEPSTHPTTYPKKDGK